MYSIFKFSFPAFFLQLLNKISGTSPDFESQKKDNVLKGQFSDQDNITCKCGWKGKEADCIKKYQMINDDTVELEYRCVKCNSYLGFVLLKDAV